jgi:hypothetical protein
MNQPLPPDFWDDPDPAPDTRQRQRRRRNCLGTAVRLLVLLLLMVVLGHLAVTQVLTRQLEKRMGGHAAVEYVEEAPAPVDPAENAITYYLEAAEVLRAGREAAESSATAGEALAPLQRHGVYGPTPSMTPEEEAILQAAVNAGEAAWPLILRAFEQTRAARWPMLFSIPHPHPATNLGERYPPGNVEDLDALREVLNFTLGAAYLRGRGGDATGACDALMVALHIAAGLWQEDLLITGMLGSHAGLGALSVARAAGEELTLPDGCLNALILATRTLRDPWRFAAQLAGEREHHRRFVRQYQQSKLSLRDRVTHPLGLWMALQVEQQYEQIFAAQELPDREQRNTLLANLGQRFPLGSMAGLTRKNEESAVRFAMAELIFQALRYRQRHGHYPAALEELRQSGVDLPRNVLELEVEFHLRDRGLELTYVGPAGQADTQTVMMWRE